VHQADTDPEPLAGSVPAFEGEGIDQADKPGVDEVDQQPDEGGAIPIRPEHRPQDEKMLTTTRMGSLRNEMC
jgi:hypothetical protein